MRYVSNRCAPSPYWKDSGSNIVFMRLFQSMNSDNLSSITDLLTGSSIETELSQSLTYGTVTADNKSLYSLMAMAGYLKAIPASIGGEQSDSKPDGLIHDELFEISIPNEEVRKAVKSIIETVVPINTGYFSEFIRAVLEGDTKGMEERFEDILIHGNYLNLKENAYEVIMMTLMHSLVKRYNVRTEHKSGFGRTDIVLEPRNDGDQYRIFELKVSRFADRLETDAKEAIEQIHRERYHLGMPGEVMLYGISFYGNTLKVLIEKVQDGRDNVLR